MQDGNAPTWMNSESFIQAVKQVAYRLEVSESDLLKQSLLHLPRFSSSDLSYNSILQSEVMRLANRMKEARRGYEHFQKAPQDLALDDLEIDHVAENIAKIIHEKFHYIGQYRKNSEHIGLFYKTKDERRIVGLISFSKFDLSHLTTYFANLEINKIMVVSRIFSFDYAPKNFVSFMISKSIDKLRNANHDVSLLLTYLNPNLGFRGTTYRASNWKLFGKEEITRYVYLDGNYATLRALREYYGITDLQTLESKLGKRLTYSVQPLEPLQIFVYPLKKHLKGEFSKDTNNSISKDPPIA